jgi:hypothetical protein
MGTRRRWEPRYQLRLVRGDCVDPPILIWGRYRTLALARHSKRLEEETPRFGEARLVLYDTWTRTVLE